MAYSVLEQPDEDEDGTSINIVNPVGLIRRVKRRSGTMYKMPDHASGNSLKNGDRFQRNRFFTSLKHISGVRATSVA